MSYLVQLAGSLAAILFLAWLARRLGLGRIEPMKGEADVRRALLEATTDFVEPLAFAIDRSGALALARDGDGRLFLLREHGARHAASRLGPDARIRHQPGAVQIETGDKRMDRLVLEVSQAHGWDEDGWVEDGWDEAKPAAACRNKTDPQGAGLPWRNNSG